MLMIEGELMSLPDCFNRAAQSIINLKNIEYRAVCKLLGW